jgi:hypothetical protein
MTFQSDISLRSGLSQVAHANLNLNAPSDTVCVLSHSPAFRDLANNLRLNVAMCVQVNAVRG